MAAEFFKKGALSVTASPSPTYPDLYDNNQTTADISSGSFDTDGDGITDKNRTSMFIADIDIPKRPAFGSSELKGLRFGFYTNSIKLGDNQTIPGVKAYKLDRKIGDNEGGKSSGTGSLISTEGIVQFSSYHTKTGVTFGTDFSNTTTSQTRTDSSTGITMLASKPFLPRRIGYEQGRRFGQRDGSPLSSSEHFERYGETIEGVEGYPLQKLIVDGLFNSVDGADSDDYFSKEYKRWAGFNYEYWPSDDPQIREAIQYGVKVPVDSSTVIENVLAEGNFFDIVSVDRDFYDMGLEDQPLEKPRRIAYSTLIPSADTHLTGGKSLHMDALYTHRDKTTTSIFYPKRGQVDGSELQQVSFASKRIPIPTHLYSREPVTGGDGRQPVIPEIEMDLKFDSLANMLTRDQLTLGLPDHDNRLTRSFVITFGSEQPVKGQNLFNYLKKHTPNAASAGDATGTGAGTGTVKSLFGLAFVNFGGLIGVYELGSTGKSNSVYTDVSYRLDNTRGEVCFANNPSFTNIDEGLESGWARLTMQLHPNDNGMYYALSNPETDRVIAFGNSKKVNNVKNVTASGTVGLWAENMSDWPKYMTVWNNNYQGVLGQYDASAGKYKTGLQVRTDLSDDTAFKVYSTVVGTNAEDSNYLLFDAGSQITVGSTDFGHISENDNGKSTTGLGLTLAANKSASENDIVYMTAGKEDDFLVAPLTDVRNSIYIDSIRFKHFNMKIENATPMRDKKSLGRLRIPETVKLHSTGFTEGSSFTSLEDNVTQQPSYLLFGFKNLSDITDAASTGIGEPKRLLMNDFKITSSPITSTIVTSTDSDTSNIRIGYTSSIEDYGRQGAADSTRSSGAAVHPDIGNGESPVLSNNGGTPTIAFRGLVAGDLDTGTNEFSVEANASGTDGVGNVDYFSQKGMMKFIAKRRVSGAVLETLANNSNAAMAVSDTTFKVADASVFTLNGFIKMADEIMKVTNINTSTEVVTVTRGVEGTDALEHAHNTSIFDVAMPESRECIFASARVLAQPNSTKLIIDNPAVFNNEDDEEYILYKYNDSHSNPTSGFPKTLTVRKLEEATRTVSFDQSFILDEPGKYLISPKRFWLIVEIMNTGGAHGYQNDTVNTKYLSEKSYLNAVGISEKGTYGVTWNEYKFNDGGYINKWDLDTTNINQQGVIVLDDFGFGEYNKDNQTGGHAGIQALNTIDDVDKYNEIDFSGIVEKASIKPGETLPMMFTTVDPQDNIAINIDTEVGTNAPYVLAKFEDELPKVNSFSVKPNEEDAFDLDFEWECEGDDFWYGFIMVDENNISSQYTNAILHYPMNEEGSHGSAATAPVEQIQCMTTAIDGATGTGPFYDVEGLAGFCLRNDATNTPSIDVGTGSADPLARATKELSIVLHFVHDAATDGTLANAEMLFMKNNAMNLHINTDGTIDFLLYWDSDSYVKLTSASKVKMDGQTPTNVIVTFDANLKSGNVKLFMDGKLEDQSGEVITADASGVQTGWLFNTAFASNDNKIIMLNQTATSGVEFLGRAEEFVFYNKCIYPVLPQSNKFTFTKPLKELSTSRTESSSISYSARLFVKDYHNIRGDSVDEVAASSNIAFRKAGFRLNYT